MICSVAVLSMTLVTKLAAAHEVEGFRLGMSMQQVSQLVLEKGYKLSNPVKSGQNWTSYLLMKDGPNLSFCGNVLSSVGKSYDSNLHEFANLLTQWKSSLGEPEVEATQKYANGFPISSLRYIWSSDDNVRRDIASGSTAHKARRFRLATLTSIILATQAIDALKIVARGADKEDRAAAA